MYMKNLVDMEFEWEAMKMHLWQVIFDDVETFTSDYKI